MKSGSCYVIEISLDGQVSGYKTEKCHILHRARVARVKAETFEEKCQEVFKNNHSYYVFFGEKELLEFGESYTGHKKNEVRLVVSKYFEGKKEEEAAQKKYEHILSKKYTYVVKTVCGEEEFVDTLENLIAEADDCLLKRGESLASKLNVEIPEEALYPALEYRVYINFIIGQTPLPKVLSKIEDVLKYDLHPVI